MRRRDFILAVGGAAAASSVSRPGAARAEQAAKVARIGFLGTSSLGLELHLVDAFRQRLSELGHVEGRNVAIEYRWAEGQEIGSRPWQPNWFDFGRTSL
jgi:putative ABC transport system substrate-binding protein